MCQHDKSIEFNDDFKDKELVPKDGEFSNLDFLKFLRKSLAFISLDLVGMNLIVLKEPYASMKRIKLRPRYH